MADEQPLSRAEVLGAFVATVETLGKHGCSAGFGRITEDDEHGVTFAFSLPAFAVRKVCANHPETFKWAEKYAAHNPSGSEHGQSK